MARAAVKFWKPEEGWGAVVAADRAGLGFVHFSNIEGVEGYRMLSEGQVVEYEWADDCQQDGCQWRVAWVRLA